MNLYPVARVKLRIIKARSQESDVTSFGLADRVNRQVIADRGTPRHSALDQHLLLRFLYPADSSTLCFFSIAGDIAAVVIQSASLLQSRKPAYRPIAERLAHKTQRSLSCLAATNSDLMTAEIET